MKIIRTSTVPESINHFCKGLLRDLKNDGNEIIVVSSPGNPLTEIRDREEVKTVAVPMERHISPFKDLKSLWKLIRVFKKEKPDMVHSITPKAGLLSMMAAWICRVPNRLHTFTGLVFPTATGLTQKILILTDRITCFCATHIVPEGEGVKSDLQSYKITKKPLRVLGYGNIKGIDLSYFDPTLFPKDNTEQEGKFFNFVFVGRLVRDKGINELVSAFKKLNEKYPKTQLILVGGKEEELDPLLPETLQEIEDNTHINAVGQQSDVRPWLSEGDVFVFPSYREGFPNVVIEAGAMGLPSIVTDINGSREIIQNEVNGLIIPPRNESELYKAMEYALLNPERIFEMSKQARPLIASRFEQSYVFNCLKEFYSELDKELKG